MRKQKNRKITVTAFECKRGRLTIRGTQYLPAGTKLPIAIVSHGFMANQDTVRQYAKKLAKLGYAAYCFDFCGGCVIKGKSDGKTTEMSVLTEVKDLEAVIQYAKSMPYCDAGRIVLMGCSQGGLVSALTAAKHSDIVSKLILFYPAVCIPYDARRGKMLLAEFDPKKIPDRFRCGAMKLGRCYVEDVIRMNPYREILGFSGDVLLVHGTKDKIVDLKYVKKAYAVYKKETIEKKLDRKVELHIIKNAKHGFSKKCDRVAARYIEQFCDLH